MYLTEKQKLLLLIVLRDSLKIEGVFCLSTKARNELMESIVDQQDKPEESDGT